MVQIYGEALLRRHYASRWSAAFCFRLASHVAIVVLTFIFVHSLQGELALYLDRLTIYRM